MVSPPVTLPRRSISRSPTTSAWSRASSRNRLNLQEELDALGQRLDDDYEEQEWLQSPPYSRGRRPLAPARRKRHPGKRTPQPTPNGPEKSEHSPPKSVSSGFESYRPQYEQPRLKAPSSPYRSPVRSTPRRSSAPSRSITPTRGHFEPPQSRSPTYSDTTYQNAFNKLNAMARPRSRSHSRVRSRSRPPKSPQSSFFAELLDYIPVFGTPSHKKNAALVFIAIFIFWVFGAFSPEPGPPVQDASVVWSLGDVAQDWFVPIPAQFYVDMGHAITVLAKGSHFVNQLEKDAALLDRQLATRKSESKVMEFTPPGLRAVLPQAYKDSRELLRFCSDFKNHSASIEHRIKQDLFLRAGSDLRALKWDLTRFYVSSQQAKTWYGRWSEEGWRKAGLGLPDAAELRQNFFDGIYDFLQLQSSVVHKLWWDSTEFEADAGNLWQAYKLHFSKSVEEVEKAAHGACLRDYELRSPKGQDEDVSNSQDQQHDCDTVNPHGFIRDADLLNHEATLFNLMFDIKNIQLSLEKWDKTIKRILIDYRNEMGRQLTGPDIEARWRAWVYSREEQELERKRKNGELPDEETPGAETTTTITWPYITTQPLPTGMVHTLLHRFRCDEGYTLFGDVRPLITKLRRGEELQHPKTKTKVVIGVITNSDDRVPEVLSSLGFRVSPVRYGSSWGVAKGEEGYDFDFAVMSYDVGYEKPDVRIFRAAEEVLGWLVEEGGTRQWRKVYVGDEFDKDVTGALEAGWNAVLIDRETPGERKDLSCWLRQS
ncbi:hypothetical protein AC578_7672 [Pseudocercospora eumusae]|uniref:Uncharacterized protein n=1 Tax=Pseudocercospora eumusae TaxID=321146 RepID=A0A139GVF8_9PEZI|nr:hypothetical protein AC578_7672 [Pseudocercospora eumusae]